MGEEDLGDRRIREMQVAEADEVVLGKPMLDLVETRQHDAQPGSPAFAEGDDDAMKEVELAKKSSMDDRKIEEKKNQIDTRKVDDAKKKELDEERRREEIIMKGSTVCGTNFSVLLFL